MSDAIRVDPIGAANLLAGTNSKLKMYIQAIEQVAEALIAIGSTSFSNPMAAAMLALGKALEAAGHAVNESVTSYGNNFASVVNQWKTTDMNAAGNVSFDKPYFGGVNFTPTLDDHVDISPSRVRSLLDAQREGGIRMNNNFMGIHEDMQRSPSFVGQGEWLSKTIDTFNRYVVPVNEHAQSLLNKVHGQMENELSSFIQRDNSTYVE